MRLAALFLLGVVTFSSAALAQQEVVIIPDREIRAMSPEERTFLPEARKKPIFDALLGDTNSFHWVDNKPKGYVFTPAPYCRDVLKTMISWKGAEIIEPVATANSYDDPALAPLTGTCPGLTPYLGADSEIGRLFLGTHHYKLFRLPQKGGREIVLFYSEGGMHIRYYRGPESIKALQNRAMDAFAEPSIGGNGTYVQVDLKSCEIKKNISANTSGAFSYHASDEASWFGESAIIKSGEHYYIFESEGRGRPWSESLKTSRSVRILRLAQPPIESEWWPCNYNYWPF